MWNIAIQPAVGCYNPWANLRCSAAIRQGKNYCETGLLVSFNLISRIDVLNISCEIALRVNAVRPHWWLVNTGSHTLNLVLLPHILSTILPTAPLVLSQNLRMAHSGDRDNLSTSDLRVGTRCTWLLWNYCDFVVVLVETIPYKMLCYDTIGLRLLSFTVPLHRACCMTRGSTDRLKASCTLLPASHLAYSIYPGRSPLDPRACALSSRNRCVIFFLFEQLHELYSFCKKKKKKSFCKIILYLMH